MTSISKRDKKHIWHPLTQHKRNPDMRGIVRASGSVLYDENGKQYIDGIASWYTAMYGHCNPSITERVYGQMQKLDHVVFTGFTHEPAVRLSEELLKILPKNQSKIFFSDNGSTSTEIGIKMALQYHHNLGRKNNVLLAFEEGFHGDTFGAMSVSGLSVYNGPFEEFFIDVERIPIPNLNNIDLILKELQALILEKDIAGFIYEPLVQGAAGMKIYEATALDKILSLLKANDVLLIADEVMTGFGKTGKNFASDYMLVKPDIICLSKALTAGLMPMAATSCTQIIFEAFYHDEVAKGFFHGHTYTANPLACTAALAGIELLNSKTIQGNIKRIIQQHEDFIGKLGSHPAIESSRQCGIILALDLSLPMSRYGNLRDKLYQFFMKNGVFLRPLGNTIYVLPPFTISEEELNKIYEVITKALAHFGTN
ncbi:adenosylmethionine--8-amino-7-oxononanoate transaminase [Eudoraea chungangensis]|uniref:adenosylmethionine--8-amino-7-oxononanoate transaminase n=1 Tax=Eudoraea chungangensis TaxID=1481905 RepID=UPI0023EDF3DE|nr:adenosylmethionine--8-amino-7-oxononanoate transaminase [Eudoraea chungangensis]